MSDYTREGLAAELSKAAKEGRDPQTIDSSWIPMFFPDWEPQWELSPQEEEKTRAYASQILKHFFPELERQEVETLVETFFASDQEDGK